MPCECIQTNKVENISMLFSFFSISQPEWQYSICSVWKNGEKSENIQILQTENIHRYIYICVYSVLHRSVNDIYVKWISVFSFSSAAMPAIELVCHVPSIKIFPSFYTWMGLNRLKCIYIYIIYHAMSPSQKFSLLLAYLSTTNITTNIICPSFYIYIYVQMI